MALFEGSLGDLDVPRTTSMPTGQQHLYLIFDDWEWGYTIRKLELPLPRSPHQRQPEHERLPPPCICLEAPRGRPSFLVAVGTNIILAHRRIDMANAPVPECMLLMVDVHSMGVRFGPGLQLYPYAIFITVGDEDLFVLDRDSFRMLSMKPFCSGSQHYRSSWCDLPEPPLSSMDCTCIAVGSDGRTIFASTDCATFTFDIVNSEWRRSSDCSMPFNGRVHYVHALDIFVGFTNDLDTYGHLSFCSKLGGDDENARLGKENLLREDPAESVLGATLVYLGGSEPGFCLVECVSVITEGNSANMRLDECEQLVKCVHEEGGNCEELDQLKKYVDEGDGASRSMPECGDLDELKKSVDQGDGASRSMPECGELDELKKSVDQGDGTSESIHDRKFYRLTTFSLSFDNNEDLTTGESCVVQCYKAPEDVSERFYIGNPVAFWL